MGVEKSSVHLKFHKLERHRFHGIPWHNYGKLIVGGRLHDCPVIMGNFRKIDDPGILSIREGG